jgi:long-chain acyl-CoA synthetase
MTMSFDEAVAAVTAPGQMFSVVETEVLGRKTKVYENALPSLRTLFDLARARQGTFVVYEDERLDFAEVVAQVDAIAHMLVEHYGVTKGDRVAIGMRNYPEWIASFAAITSIGAIVVSLNAWWTAEEMHYGLEDSGATVLIADQERAERAEGAFDTLGVRTVVVRSSGLLPPGADRLEDVLVPGAAMPDVEIDPDDDATILYTSGTTGNPKGAVSTHRAVVHGLLSFGCRAAVNNLTDPPTGDPHPYPTAFILVVPLFHVTGCVAVMLSSWLAGAKLVLMYKWSPERALELIERERITNFIGVPTMSWDLLESPDFASRDTSSLLSVGGGGAPAPPELVRRVEDNFTKGRPQIGYGMTETNAYGPGNTGDDYVRKPTSSGRFVPPTEVKIAGKDGEALPPGEVGEICFAGPTLIRGYWNKPEATAEAIVDGWLYSGDIGRLDEEGFLYIEDRAKDMILRGGENVYSAEVEAAIYEHPAVYEAAVFGLPHERLGEEVAVAIVPREGRSIDPDELRSFLAEQIAPFKIPTQVFFFDEALPRNPAGKILKRQLRDELTADA